MRCGANDDVGRRSVIRWRSLRRAARACTDLVARLRDVVRQMDVREEAPADKGAQLVEKLRFFAQVLHVAPPEFTKE